MRPLVAHDFEAWSEVRLRNVDWLTVWEPRRSDFLADPATDRDAFERRCVARDRERLAHPRQHLRLDRELGKTFRHAEFVAQPTIPVGKEGEGSAPW